MSCAHPFLFTPDTKIKKYYRETGLYGTTYIPCGWCLNCRVDKQNELTHRCEKELINYKCGAFVTLTYDDLHILPNLRKDSENHLVATLSKSDCKKYLDRLRHNIKNRMPNNLLSNHNFKYLVVGEYGGDGQVFDRPHLHILLFGLDFALCRKEIEKAWQGNGMIKCLPILQGGIQYVLKYLDKQLHGLEAQIKYDNNNIERPFQNHSLGLGSSLYADQKDYIESHNCCYRWKGKDVPVPPYYKNKYYFHSNSDINKLKAQKLKYEKVYNIKFKNWYDLHDFKIQKNQLREQNLEYKNRIAGKPISYYYYQNVTSLKHVSQEYIKDLAIKALNITNQVPF